VEGEGESRVDDGERAAKACLFVDRPCEVWTGLRWSQNLKWDMRRLAVVVVGGKGEGRKMERETRPKQREARSGHGTHRNEQNSPAWQKWSTLPV